MKLSNDYIFYLWRQYVTRQITPEELDQLYGQIRDAALDDENIRMFQQSIASIPASEHLSTDVQADIWNQILQLMSDPTAVAPMAEGLSAANQPIHPISPIRPARRVPLLRQWVAAAILLCVVAGGYLWYQHRQTQESAIVQEMPITTNDVQPGGNKAILTLSGGRQIVLDSAHEGELAIQGDVQVTKTDSGKLVYQPIRKSMESAVAYNTLTIPRGGHYQLTLPDGTRVWLNAASSITYPIAFPGAERKVTINGEAYLEVSRNSRQPFIAQAGDISIQVLGTSFNINAYTDEPAVKAVLTEGSIRVSHDTSSVVVRPGEQALLKKGDNAVRLGPANVDAAIAWKNGIFELANADVASIMRQVARWYDVEVMYKGNVPKGTISGEVPRSLNLSEMVKVLALSGIRCNINERKLIVSE
jgi:ferric-dicitrate binding protein FerR (iron transport regulator)